MSVFPNNCDMNHLAAIPCYWPRTYLRQREAERRTHVFEEKKRQNSFAVMSHVSEGLDVPQQQFCARNTSATGGGNCPFDGPGFAGLPRNIGKV